MSNGREAKRKSASDTLHLAGVLAPFVVFWAVYLGLRAGMPGDALEPFRNGLYWPDSDDLLLAKGGGIVSRIALHLGFTFALGLTLGLGVFLVKRLFSKRPTISRVSGFVCFTLAFLLMLGVVTVPNQLTRVEAKRSKLVVEQMVPVPPFTVATKELAFDKVEALGVRLGVRGTKSKERVVRLYALPAIGEPLELGEAECPGADDECLRWADPAAELVAERLGWNGKLHTSTEDSGKLRRYEPTTRRD